MVHVLVDVMWYMYWCRMIVTGNDLERGLKRIGREDVTRTCMTNVEVVTDQYERQMARQQLDDGTCHVILRHSHCASMFRTGSQHAALGTPGTRQQHNRNLLCFLLIGRIR